MATTIKETAATQVATRNSSLRNVSGFEKRPISLRSPNSARALRRLTKLAYHRPVISGITTSNAVR
ncbi:MAG: hypothetical protein H6677_02035 [Candidatus Obscuribacterales bacterium]|nr:hypothetical protein [Candidatus Obscuribacterales bacterium]